MTKSSGIGSGSSIMESGVGGCGKLCRFGLGGWRCFCVVSGEHSEGGILFEEIIRRYHRLTQHICRRYREKMSSFGTDSSDATGIGYSSFGFLNCIMRSSFEIMVSIDGRNWRTSRTWPRSQPSAMQQQSLIPISKA